MMWRGDGDHVDVADVNELQVEFGRQHAPADADHRRPVTDELGDSAQGFHVQPKLHGRELSFEGLHGVDEASARQHHVDREGDFGLDAAKQ